MTQKRLSQLHFATQQICPIQALHSSWFNHCSKIVVLSSVGCNCYKLIDPGFAVPSEARVALLNTDELGTRCEMIHRVRVSEVISGWKVKNNQKVLVQGKLYFQLELSNPS